MSVRDDPKGLAEEREERAQGQPCDVCAAITLEIAVRNTLIGLGLLPTGRPER